MNKDLSPRYLKQMVTKQKEKQIREERVKSFVKQNIFKSVVQKK